MPTNVSFQAKCLIQEFNIADLGVFGCELLSMVYVNNAKSQVGRNLEKIIKV